MPFPTKIRPVDDDELAWPLPSDLKPTAAAKWRFKRLFERQRPQGVVVEKEELEPSSVCLARMVQNFLEESSERPGRCGRRRCKCSNGTNCDDTDDDDVDLSSPDPSEILKSLVLCSSTSERNLLADTARIVEKHKVKGAKLDSTRKLVAESLASLGHNAAVCKSQWPKSPSFPAGEYEYIDVIVDSSGDRLIIDIDFRSEFEIVRSTKAYKSILQILPIIFVGKPDRLQQIVSVAAEAAKQSMKKKGLHVPPWRRQDYMCSKWLAPHNRLEKTGDGSGLESNSGESTTELDLRLEKSGELELAGVSLGSLVLVECKKQQFEHL